MTRWSALTCVATLSLVAALAFPLCAQSPPERAEREALNRALRTGDCAAVDDVWLRIGFSEAEGRFVADCWKKRQAEIIPRAMETNRCEPALDLPGVYPQRSAAENRFVHHCWMRHAVRDLDSCIAMMELGDETSLGLVVTVLKRNEPTPDPSGKLHLIDTAHACLSAYQRIEKLTAAVTHLRAAGWSGRWRRWSRQQ